MPNVVTDDEEEEVGMVVGFPGPDPTISVGATSVVGADDDNDGDIFAILLPLSFCVVVLQLLILLFLLPLLWVRS